MTTNGWLIVGLAVLLGMVVGGFASIRFARLRYAKRLRRVVDELTQKHAATAEQLRTAQARASAELEQVRSGFKRQLAAASEEPRAAVARLEERLNAAYAELDRLRDGVGARDTSPAELSDGFAATRPMREGM